MLKKLPFIFALAGATLSATSAQALSIVFRPGDAGADPVGDTTIIEYFDTPVVPNGTSYNGGVGIYSGTTSDAAQPAFWSSGQYLGVQNDQDPLGNFVSFSITVPKTQVLSFVLGSLDTYNQVILKFLKSPDVVLDGSAIIGRPSNYLDGITGDQKIALTNGRVFYHTDGLVPLDAIVGAEFRSFGADAFEIDNISIATPEPATWGMMIFAAGMAGTALRRRRNRTAIA